MSSIGLVLGILLYYYPSYSVLCLVFFQQKPVLFLLSVSCAYMLMMFHTHGYHHLNDEHLQTYQGKILSFYDQHRYLIELTEMNHQPITGLIHLRCYPSCPQAYPGEYWQWQAKMLYPVRTSNSGTWNIWYRDDFRHIVAKATIQAQVFKRLRTVPAWDVFNRLRIYIYREAQQKFSAKQAFAKHVFLALVLGIGQALSSEDWQLFKVTATVHLMVVSGAHLSLLMGICSASCSFLWRLSARACLWVPVQRVASIVSILFGIFYAVLCGFGVPIQRALWMYMMAQCRYFYPHRIDTYAALRLSFMLIILYEPHAVFYPGTYLSFLAVWMLMITPGIFHQRSWMRHILQQMMCLIGMAPLSILWFSSLAWLGVLANLVAIPWVSYVVLPLAMLNIFSWSGGHYLYVLSTEILNFILRQMSAWSAVNWHIGFSNMYLFILSSLLLCFICLPLAKLRMYALCLIWPAFFLQDKATELMMDVLDVGQGLAVLIKTKQHQLLFDTGGSLGRSNMAARVILPYLKSQGIDHLDKMVLSHPDQDHIAGKQTILDNMLVFQIIDDKNCQKQAKWCWDGICFEFLDYAYQDDKKNNHSCVLKVANILLTADIERPIESELLHRYGHELKSDILLVPHHGSQSSSSASFIDVVRPNWAVASVAAHNRYHLPKPSIVERYHFLKIAWLDTAHAGMLRFSLQEQFWRYLAWRQRGLIDILFTS